MSLFRFAPDFVMLALGVWIALQGRDIRRKTRNLEALHDDVKRLASVVLQYAGRVDALEASSSGFPPFPETRVESSADYAKHVGTIEASYCRVKGLDGVLTPFGTILVGDASAWGTLLSSGPGWAEFSTGHYLLQKATQRREQDGIAL